MFACRANSSGGSYMRTCVSSATSTPFLRVTPRLPMRRMDSGEGERPESPPDHRALLRGPFRPRSSVWLSAPKDGLPSPRSPVFYPFLPPLIIRQPCEEPFEELPKSAVGVSVFQSPGASSDLRSSGPSNGHVSGDGPAHSLDCAGRGGAWRIGRQNGRIARRQEGTGNRRPGSALHSLLCGAAGPGAGS